MFSFSPTNTIDVFRLDSNITIECHSSSLDVILDLTFRKGLLHELIILFTYYIKMKRKNEQKNKTSMEVVHTQYTIREFVTLN